MRVRDNGLLDGNGVGFVVLRGGGELGLYLQRGIAELGKLTFLLPSLDALLEEGCPSGISI